jgi:HSP20 family protein
MNKTLKTNTISPLFDTFNYFDAIFDDAFSGMIPSARKLPTLKTDYFLEDGELTINVDVPGSSSEDVIVDFNKDNYLLYVKVAKQYEKKESKPQFYRRERVISDQTRTFQLPSDIDVDSISAKVENGLLTVKAKTIKINPVQSTLQIKVN